MATYSNLRNTLRSADASITTPTEIEVTATRATARHADSGDVSYPSLAALCAAYMVDEADVRALPVTGRLTEWNQSCTGNAHVEDGSEGFWAEFAPGTSAQSVLDNYMDTADYSGATGTFTVTAEIDGHCAECRVGPGGARL